ncbi:MAG: EAL domain-containing protein [Chloroflexota bacterium]|nr:EAL domain-containing protein [Chloroflexota bacterium]
MRDIVAELVAKWSVPSTLLHLEITESAIMADPRKAMDVLARQRALRVEISIDDFGTGYSSMEYLKRLPIGFAQDRHVLILDMASDKRDLAIVRSVIEPGHNIGLRVIVEGVENLTTLTLLDQLGCDAAQGWHVGPSALWASSSQHQARAVASSVILRRTRVSSG